jgi:hypothetical protein
MERVCAYQAAWLQMCCRPGFFLARGLTSEFSKSAPPTAAAAAALDPLRRENPRSTQRWLFSEWTLRRRSPVSASAVWRSRLGAHKILENFIGGVSLLMDKAVSAGDFCEIGGKLGDG